MLKGALLGNIDSSNVRVATVWEAESRVSWGVTRLPAISAGVPKVAADFHFWRLRNPEQECRQVKGYRPAEV